MTIENEQTDGLKDEPSEFIDSSIEESGEDWGAFAESMQEDEASDILSEDSGAIKEEEVIPVELASEELEVIPPVAEDIEIPKPSEEIPQPDPVVLDETLKANREMFRESLVKSYALSEEDADALVLDPTNAFPKLAADIHLKVMEQVVGQMQQMLPQAMQTVTTSQASASKNEEAFFAQWPELKGHDALIAQQARQFRSQNPTATIEDAIKMTGFNTLLALKVDPVKAAARLAKGYVPQAEADSLQKVAKPHTPMASARTRSARQEQAPSPSLWQEMVED